jgi:hypothetical protein
VAWTKSPQTGTVKVAGAQSEAMRLQNLFFGPLQWEDLCSKLTIGSDIAFDGRPAHQVVCQLQPGAVTFYVDRQTALVIGSRTVSESTIGRIEVVTTFRGYKDFGPVRLPSEILVEAAGQTQKFTVESVETALPDASQFVPPK